MEEQRTVRAVVSGRVQGVWYRAHTESKARELGLIGYVRNQADGTVEIVARGSSDEVQELLDWTWRGSPNSKVTQVEVEEYSPSGALESFTTRY